MDMCRQAIFNLRSAEAFIDIIDKLVKSAKHDPRATWDDKMHNDGWGIVLVSRGPGSLAKLFYKSIKPIFDDDISWIRSIIGSGPISGMIHARKASDGEPKNVDSSHPHEVFVGDGFLYLVHNGSVDKLLIAGYMADEFGYKLSTGEISDTKALLILLSAIYEKTQNLEAALMELAQLSRNLGIIRTSLNIGVMHVSEKGEELFAASMYSRNTWSDERKRNYLDMYLLKDEDNIIVASPTLVDDYGLETGNKELLQPEFDKMIIVDLRNGRKITA